MVKWGEIFVDVFKGQQIRDSMDAEKKYSIINTVPGAQQTVILLTFKYLFDVIFNFYNM